MLYILRSKIAHFNGRASHVSVMVILNEDAANKSISIHSMASSSSRRV